MLNPNAIVGTDVGRHDREPRGAALIGLAMGPVADAEGVSEDGSDNCLGPLAVDGRVGTPPPRPTPMATQKIGTWTPALVASALASACLRSFGRLVTARAGDGDHA